MTFLVRAVRSATTVSLLLVLLVVASACGSSREGAANAVEDATASSVDDAPDDTATDDTATDGADDAGSGDDETDQPVGAVPSTPPTTQVASKLAATLDLGSGVEEITHGDLAEVAFASRSNTEFVEMLLGGQVPAGFDSSVLTGMLIDRTLDQELADNDAAVSGEDESEARQSLVDEVVPFLTSGGPAEAEAFVAEVPYMDLLVSIRAKQQALGKALADGGDASGVPCVRHILVETEAEGDELVVSLNGGADFAELAAEHSTGPSGPNGGDLGCAATAQYVPEFAAAVDSATKDDIVGPVQTDFGWHVITVYDSQVDYTEMAGEAWTGRLQTATVDVDTALGIWDPASLSVIGG